MHSLYSNSSDAFVVFKFCLELLVVSVSGCCPKVGVVYPMFTSANEQHQDIVLDLSEMNSLTLLF